MIKANELRIGNLVAKGGEWFKADYITIHMAHNYDPIPLTPEILEKCGFTHSVNHHLDYFKDSTPRNNFFTFRLGRPFRHEGFWWEEKEYLHQLQNLYFAITGEELEYKPEMAHENGRPNQEP